MAGTSAVSETPSLNMDELEHSDVLTIKLARKALGLRALDAPAHYQSDGCKDDIEDDAE